MFDPYHKWLGIPKDQRPPTYYQLLGISPTEQDREVIEEAAIRQTAHVRTYQIGPHAAECTRVLNEIAQARTTLLHPAKRREYDARLNQARAKAATAAPKLVATNVTTAPPPRPAAATQPFDFQPAPLLRQQAPTAPVNGNVGRARPRPAAGQGAAGKWLLVGGLGFGVVVVPFLVWLLFLSGSDKPDRKRGKKDSSVQANKDRAEEDADDKAAGRNKGKKRKAKSKPAKKGDKGKTAPGPDLKVQSGPVVALAVSPDGRYALAASGNTAQLWDLKKGLLHSFKHQAPVWCVAFSPDGHSALTGSGMVSKGVPVDCTMRWLDLDRREEIRLYKHPSPVRCVAFAADGKRALSGSGEGEAAPNDCSVRLWDLNKGSVREYAAHTNWVTSVAFIRNGDWALSVGKDLVRRQWHLKPGTHLITDVKAIGRYTLLTATPDEKYLLAVTPANAVHLIVSGRNKPEQSFGPFPEKVHCLAISPDDRLALVGCGGPVKEERKAKAPGEPGVVYLLDLDQGKQLARLKGHPDPVTAVAFAPKGKFALTGSRGKIIRLDLAKYLSTKPPPKGDPEEVVNKPPKEELDKDNRDFKRAQGNIVAIALSGDGRYALSRGGKDGLLPQLWEVKTGKELSLFPQGTQAFAVALSADGRRALLGGLDDFFPKPKSQVHDPALMLWDVKERKKVKSLHMPYHVQAVALSADGMYALSGGVPPTGKEVTLHLWDLDTGAKVREYKGQLGNIIRVDFSADGRRVLALTSRGFFHRWDRESAKLLIPRGLGDELAAYTPDGNYVLKCEEGRKKVCLLTVKNRRRVIFQGFQRPITALAVSADHRRALVGCAEGRAKKGGQKVRVGGPVFLLDLQKRKQLGIYQGLTNTAHAVAFAPGGRTALLGSTNAIRVWDIKKYVPRGKPDEEEPKPKPKDELVVVKAQGEGRFAGSVPITHLVASPDGRHLLTATYHGVQLWDLTTGKALRGIGNLGEIKDVAVSPDGKFALIGTGTATPDKKKMVLTKCGLTRWDLGDGKAVKDFKAKTPVAAVAYSPGGRIALTGGGHQAPQKDGKYAWVETKLCLWDLEKGEVVKRIPGQANVIVGVAFSRDGKYLSSLWWNNILCCQTRDTGKLVRGPLKLPSGKAALSRTGRHILVGDNTGGVVLLDARGKQVRSFPKLKGPVQALAFSPDGKRALVGCGEWSEKKGEKVVVDGAVYLLDLKKGRPVARFLVGDRLPRHVTFTPGGRYALAGEGNSFRMWDLKKLAHVPPGKTVPADPHWKWHRPKPQPRKKPDDPPKPDPTKAPVPAADAQEKAKKLLHTLFRKEYQGKKPKDWQALAEELLRKAESGSDDAATRFVMLQEARDLGTKAIDPLAAGRAVDRLAALYRVDLLAARTKLLADLGRSASRAADHKAVVDQALDLLERAVAADRWGATADILAAAKTAAEKSRNPALVKQVQARQEETAAVKKWSDHLEAARRTLKDNPQDQDANRDVGKFLCLGKGDWEKGLPLLRRGSDVELQKLAAKELAKPAKAAAQADLADQWHQLASREKSGAVKTQLLRRAYYWYDRALPGLGGNRAKQVKARIKQLDRLPEIKPPEEVGELYRLTGHTGKVIAVAISRDGRYALSGTDNGEAWLWDLRTGKVLHRFAGHTTPVIGVAFSRAGKLAVTGAEGGGMLVWTVTSGKLVKQLAGQKPLGSLTLVRDGRSVYGGTTAGEIYRYPVAGGANLITGVPGGGTVRSLSLSPHNKYLAFVIGQGKVFLWNLRTRKLVKPLRSKKPFTCVVFSPALRDSGIVTGSADASVRLWDVTGRTKVTFRGHQAPVLGVAISDNNRRIVSTGEDGTVRLWDVPTRRQFLRFPWHSGKVRCIALSADGRRAVSGGDDKTVRVWALPK
jgi:WD40 repeat protein